VLTVPPGVVIAIVEVPTVTVAGIRTLIEVALATVKSVTAVPLIVIEVIAPKFVPEIVASVERLIVCAALVTVPVARVAEAV
jgi:hypothetical protein